MQEAEEKLDQNDEMDSYIARWKSWPEIKKRLLQKDVLSDVARWLQATEPEARDRKVESLTRLLSRIRTKLGESEVAGKLAELQSKAAEAQSNADATGKVAEYIDVLESLGQLFTLQMARITDGRAIETKVKYLIAKMTGDIGEAREILKFMFEVQQDLGLTKRRPSSAEGAISKMTFAQRQQVADALQMVRQRAMAKQIELKAVEQSVEEVIDTKVADAIIESADKEMMSDIESTDQEVLAEQIKVMATESKDGLPFE